MLRGKSENNLTVMIQNNKMRDNRAKGKATYEHSKKRPEVGQFSAL